MNTSNRPCERPIPTCSRTGSREGEDQSLPASSYTAQRLENATAEHLHVTNRRYFIGPLPRGWLQNHRRSWYKSWLGFKNFSSKSATFNAETSFHQRQLTGFLGPSTAAMYRQSFPQPEDVDIEDEEYETSDTTPENQSSARIIAPVDTSHAVSETDNNNNNNPFLTAENGETNGRRKKNVAARLGADDSNPTVRLSSQEQMPETFFTAPDPSQTENTPNRIGATHNGKEPDSRGRRVTLEVARENFSPDRSSNVPTTKNSAISIDRTPSPGESGSRASLIPRESHASAKPSGDDTIVSSPSPDLQHKEPREETEQVGAEAENSQSLSTGFLSNITSRRIRKSISQDMRERRRRIHRSISRSQQVRSAKKQQQQASRCGEIVRAEKMLVRIETTSQSVPDDYNENASIKLDTRTTEKWKEYLVVCRQGCDDQTPFLLQMYKTRVIPQVQISQMKRDWNHEVGLSRASAKVNLFSTLDKTIVLWHPYKMGTTRIFIMRPRSAAHSVEWYTFIRKTLGWNQPSTLFVHAPDLDVSLVLQNPFTHIEKISAQNEEEDECAIILKTMAEEKAIASGIIKTCMNTLSECSEWAQVLQHWLRKEKMGLAWRRYDRLEWIQGANEDRMYGTIAMRTTHELELRPKQHYPTSTRVEKGGDKVEEPPPTEGFLVLLTSQKGAQKRFGKMFFRKLYFYTEDQYLCFCRPARANPPPPPKIPTIFRSEGSHAPTSSEIRRESPILYDIDPYPLDDDGKIAWITPRKKMYTRRRDEEARAENGRNASNLAHAEGYLNLCRIAEVRQSCMDGEREDPHTNGGDVEYHGHARCINVRNLTDGSTRSHRGQQQQSKCDRTFDIVLDDGLVVRLRAYSKQTRDAWIERLTGLSRYWKARTKDDITALKTTRQRNLEHLEIDEEQESMLGQFAQKWEVSRAEASPELYHTCGMSGCRAVKMSGHLYRKPRRRATFAKCSVILIEGQLLIFQGSLRKSSGEPIPHTHHDRKNVINLRDCYVYSGIITSSDLVYQNQSFDSNLPGHHSTPRIYLSDGWTSADEDTATCFVIWYGTRKVLFRSEEEDNDKVVRRRWRHVSALGASGRSIVFKARSRAERDLWVLAIETEIDRLQQQEDLRIVRKP